jgi:hypothetical protein
MPRQPLFAGLVVDEHDQPVETAYVGDEPCYVVNDAGFRRHILSEQVDRAVLEMMRSQISGNENELGEQAAKMLGQDDIFSKAMLQSQFKNIGQQFDMLMQVGIPEDARAYLGMAGFKIVINVHGEVVRFDQPTAIDDGDGGDE